MKSFYVEFLQGLKSSAFGLKSRNPDFLKEIDDVVVLQETWCRGDVSTGCPLGYREIIIPSTKLKGIRQGKDSVGMLIWYKSELTHSIKLIKTGPFLIWLKNNKEAILTDKNVFLCATYIPPQSHPTSMKRVPPFQRGFQAQGNGLVCGDLNARTAE